MGAYENYSNALRARNQFTSGTGMGYDAAGRSVFSAPSYAGPGETSGLRTEHQRLESELANAGQDLAQANMAHQQRIDEGQVAHERGLQAREQSRREYDSMTNRKKFGVIGGLLAGRQQIGGAY
jgi:hypothetical protein